MKARRRDDGPKQPVVLEGKGMQYSEVAEEVERTYAKWLSSAGWDEEQLLESIDQPLFDLNYEQKEREISVTLENRNGVICTPICWNEDESILTPGEFKVDCALLLIYIAHKKIQTSRTKQIESFVRVYLL